MKVSVLNLFNSQIKLAKQRAFTLAEVLITLGIIGVVAAMTIPTLISKIDEKRTVNQVKRSYSILSNALRLAIADENPIDNWGFSGKSSEPDAKIAGAQLKKYLHYAYDCGTKDTKELCFKNTKIKNLDGTTKNAKNPATDTWMYKVKLQNGASIAFFPRAFTLNMESNTPQKILQIILDVNGPEPPNTMGKDTFQFMWYSDKELAAHGSPDSTADYAQTCAIPGSGVDAGTGNGCAYYIMTFGNMNYLH